MIMAIKNFVSILFLYILTLLVALLATSYLFAYLAYGKVPIYPLDNIKLFWQVFKWLLSNFYKVNLSYNNYFVAKFLGSFMAIYGTLFTVVYIYRERIFSWRPYKKKESVHGDARWASEEDIKKAGLREKHGLMLGQDKKGYFVAGGFQHALLFAPTGSGKGVGFVIPNLLFWNESCVVHDIKLENYDLTSGYRLRKLKQKVYVWSPADPDGFTHCYNPIDWVSAKPGQMVDDVQKIANLILPEKEFWTNEARTLFVGIVLYLLAVPDKAKTFGEVVRTIRSDDVSYNLAVVLDTIGKYIHPVAYMNLAAFLQKAEKERSGVISTLNSGLELWANPLIDTATSRSDFDFQKFKKEKTTVYVGLTPDNIQRLQPLMQVFYQQSTEFLSRKIPKKDEEPYGVLFVMDEFPTLGKMEQFMTGIAYFRGYNVRLFLIIQDTEQLKGTYEEAGMNSFLSNSTYRITFAANNMETANLISQLCGNKTVEQSSQNKPKYLDFNPASRSLHVSEVQRALLLPQEVILLPRDEQIVLIESFPPIKSKKIKYYEDKFFTKKLLPPIDLPQQEPYDPNKAKKAKEETKKQSEEEVKKEQPLISESKPIQDNNIENGFMGNKKDEDEFDIDELLSKLNLEDDETDQDKEGDKKNSWLDDDDDDWLLDDDDEEEEKDSEENEEENWTFPEDDDEDDDEEDKDESNKEAGSSDKPSKQDNKEEDEDYDWLLDDEDKKDDKKKTDK